MSIATTRPRAKTGDNYQRHIKDESDTMGFATQSTLETVRGIRERIRESKRMNKSLREASLRAVFEVRKIRSEMVEVMSRGNAEDEDSFLLDSDNSANFSVN